MNYSINKEYIDLGFNISKIGDKSLALMHQDRTIFCFGSDLDLRDGFIDRLCESYLTLIHCYQHSLN